MYHDVQHSPVVVNPLAPTLICDFPPDPWSVQHSYLTIKKYLIDAEALL